MFDKLFIEAVNERDIDLLLQEELVASPVFRKWLVDKVYQDDQPAGQLVGVWHSVSRDPLGESDLVYVEQDEEGCRAVLIENKIESAPQPEQAERYQSRGQAGVDGSDWYDFRTCLVAPRKYLQGTTNATLYDAQISYEQIRNFLRVTEGTSARMEHKSAILDAAIDRNRRGYQPVPHPQVTEFWHDYWRCVRDNYPQLFMHKPGIVPARSDWPEFGNPALGKSNKIVHKLAFGQVDLYFGGFGRQQEEIAFLNQDLFDEDIIVAGTQKTAFVQIRVPPIDRFRPFAEQQEIVDAAIQAAVKLLELFPKIQLPDLSTDADE